MAADHKAAVADATAQAAEARLEAIAPRSSIRASSTLRVA
jgi:hypothetical protein